MFDFRVASKLMSEGDNSSLIDYVVKCLEEDDFEFSSETRWAFYKFQTHLENGFEQGIKKFLILSPKALADEITVEEVGYMLNRLIGGAYSIKGEEVSDSFKVSLSAYVYYKMCVPPFLNYKALHI